MILSGNVLMERAIFSQKLQNNYIISTAYVPRLILSSLHILTYLILPITPMKELPLLHLF